MRLPDWSFTTALLRRGVFLWFGVRMLLALAGGGGISASGLLPLEPLVVAPVVLLVGLLGLLEARRRNEHLLLANFGVSQERLTGISIIPAVCAEAVVRLVGQ